MTLASLLNACVNTSEIGDTGVCSGLNAPFRGLTEVLVTRGAELIEEGFSDVLTSAEPVVLGFRSVCTQ